jgi:hypothetical protein
VGVCVCVCVSVSVTVSVCVRVCVCVCDTQDGDNPLHWACEVGCEDVVRYLVEKHGADVGHRNKVCPPLPSRVSSPCPLPPPINVAPCHRRAAVCDQDGMTPLHFAARRGSCEVMTLLVRKYRADVDVKSKVSYRIPIPLLPWYRCVRYSLCPTSLLPNHLPYRSLLCCRCECCADVVCCVLGD